MSTLEVTVGTIKSNIINPALTLFFVLGMVVFAWGVVQFIIAYQNADTAGVEAGKRHMIWGILGLAIMISAFGIINFVQGTLNAISV
ncbi:MAG: hypothetical protein Q8P93_00250 [bacterium]|nr:hypothetical protein [bacterium]